jgi:hypothetical protein
MEIIDIIQTLIQTDLFTEISDLVLKLGVATIIGILSNSILVFFGENFLSSKHNKLTFSLLPPIATAITFTISGDIALSLGMVGALSIVRFRTPVRNPFELIIYFYLITIGISSAVNISIALVLFLLISTVLVSFQLFGKDEKISKNNNQLNLISKSEFNYSKISYDLSLVYFKVTPENYFEYYFVLNNLNDEETIDKIRQMIGKDLIELNYTVSIDEN